ncbi:unnamed protein product [Prunus armeniaca]|uniref:Uncharacterized protein n=1 Tax=Prunus armeniaca TaxID=36596 RepID=A0A6J5TQH5_PRUAR|nr:unnamed protein product [Prunus armeniaca]
MKAKVLKWLSGRETPLGLFQEVVGFPALHCLLFFFCAASRAAARMAGPRGPEAVGRARALLCRRGPRRPVRWDRLGRRPPPPPLACLCSPLTGAQPRRPRGAARQPGADPSATGPLRRATPPYLLYQIVK